jgi:hypothetical protein
MKRVFLVSLSLTCFMGALWLRPEQSALELSREPSSHPKNAEASVPAQTKSLKQGRSVSHAFGAGSESGSAVNAANTYLALHREELGIQSYHQLKPEEHVSPLGTAVKYLVYQGSHLVMGLTLEIFVNRKGAVSRVVNGYRPIEEASEQAWNQPVREFVDGLTKFEAESTPVPLFYVPESSSVVKAEAAYAVEVKNKLTQETHQGIFRASDGQVLALSKGRGEL